MWYERQGKTVCMCVSPVLLVLLLLLDASRTNNAPHTHHTVRSSCPGQAMPVWVHTADITRPPPQLLPWAPTAQVINLCEDHQLHSALAYIHNSLGDYRRPVLDLLAATAFAPSPQRKRAVGLKLLVYLRRAGQGANKASRQRVCLGHGRVCVQGARGFCPAHRPL